MSALLPLFVWSGSCRRIDSTVYSQFARIPAEGWTPGEYITFLPYPTDSIINPADRFSLTLHIRYNSSRASGPLKMTLTTEDDEGYTSQDTLSIPLFSTAGTPLGKGSRQLYELTVPIRDDFRLTPGYLITMQSLSPESRTRGILDIGISMTLCSANFSVGSAATVAIDSVSITDSAFSDSSNSTDSTDFSN